MADTVYLDSLEETEVLLSKLSQPVRDWFKDKFPDFTEPQKMAIPSIVDGEHLLLCSPTGSGKTLTAFLSMPGCLFVTSSISIIMFIINPKSTTIIVIIT